MSKYCNHCMALLQDNEGSCPVCGKNNAASVPAHHLLPGTILNGKFYVGEALGEGGFGITYIGRDIKLDMKVAIKEFYPNGYVNRSNTVSPQVNDSVTEGRKDFFEKGRDRFLKEAQTLAKFSGEPGVVDVRDFFEENNTAYIIMEYLDGVDLKTYLKKNGTLTAEQTVQLLMPVMNSLKKVHAQGLIHRDISPDNIMIIGDKVKLLDFGAARTVSAEANKSLSVMLKPGYAPEEQYRSKGNQGPWTDIYALCATMYKCITGITPDDATQRVFSDEVKTPTALNFAIKPEIEKAIMRGMSVHQNDRYQCIEDLIRGLQGIEVELSGVDRTVAAGKNVAEDNIATVYVSGENDVQTIMGADPEPAKSEIKRPAPNKSQKQAPPVNNTPVNNTPVNNSTANNNSQPQKGKSNTALIAVIAVAAVAIIALIVVLVMSGGDDNDNGGDNSSHYSEIIAESNDDNTSTPVSTPDNNDSSAPVVSTPDDSSATEEVITMSDNLFDYTFELEGVVYKLPFKYEKLTQNGWTISSSGYNSETKIPGNKYDYFYMSKDGRKICVYSYNMSGNTKPIKDCMVGGIECEAYQGASFIMAKGITTASTAEEVKTAFGVPGSNNVGDDYESITYYDGNNTYDNSVKFYCASDAKYTSITIKNFVETEADKTTTNTEKPSYLNEYKKPTSMGSTFTSAVVELEGELYQMPSPVSVFLDNGWKIVQKNGDVVAGGTDYMTVEKNGKRIDLYIANFADYQTTVENCAVYKVEVGEDEAEIRVGSSVAFVTIGTSKEDVDKMAVGFDCYDGTYSYSYSYYEYKERDFSMYIYVDKETGKVDSVSVSCKTWKY